MYKLDRTTHHCNIPYPHTVTSYPCLLKPLYPLATPPSHILTCTTAAPGLTFLSLAPESLRHVYFPTETTRDVSGSIRKPTYRPNKWVRKSTHLHPSDTPIAPVLSANPAHHPLLVVLYCTLWFSISVLYKLGCV